MNKYTVVFLHTMPIGEGFAAAHCSLEVAESPEAAAEKCKGSLGGYMVLICVFEGHNVPLLKGRFRRKVMVWDYAENYDTKEIDVASWPPIKEGHEEDDEDE